MDFANNQGDARQPASSGNGRASSDLPQNPPSATVQTGLSSDSSLRAEPIDFGRNGAPAPKPERAANITPVWVQRVWLIMFVMFCIELGMLLAVLPWTRVWTESSLLYDHPALRAFVQQNFVRGAVTGLGLVDIWIGIWEAVRYREKK
jgi:hypothetical protein